MPFSHRPALFITADGSHSLFVPELGVSYHSRFGAVQETRHVFIDAALRFKAVVQHQISILEMGFGTGLNAYMTWLESRKRNVTIRYTAVEAFPVDPGLLQSLNFPDLLQSPEAELDFLALHEAAWNEPVSLDDQFTLTKVRLFFEEYVPEGNFDIIYFDVFAPDAQPHLWELPMLKKMYDALRPDGLLVTYCAKGVVKRRLREAGFIVEAIKGPPGKREMTRALKI